MRQIGSEMWDKAIAFHIKLGIRDNMDNPAQPSPFRLPVETVDGPEEIKEALSKQYDWLLQKLWSLSII